MNKFTYIISSLDDVSGNNDRANNCNIRINSLPLEYNYFKVRVNTFMINVGSLETAYKDKVFLYLVANNFISSHQLITGNRVPNVLAVVNTTNDGQITNIDNSFVVRNMNGSVINFQLLDDGFDEVAVGDFNQNNLITTWTLILEFEGLQ